MNRRRLLQLSASAGGVVLLSGCQFLAGVHQTPAYRTVTIGVMVGNSFDSRSTQKLALLREIVPGLSRLAVLWNGVPPGQVEDLQAAAPSVGVQLLVLIVRSEAEVESALGSALGWSAEVLMPLADGGPINQSTPRIIDFAARNRLPAAYNFNQHVEAGGLISYGPSLADEARRAAAYVDRILKGAKPADLPVEQPTEFDLAINRTTAQALGLTVPPDVAHQVTEWVE